MIGSAQTFDMTFDLSVFDLFVAWSRGACVCVMPSESFLKPAGWIAESELTVWFSVPSLALHMKRFGMLKPDRFPTLRWSLFCGEALPVEAAEAWAAAAPASVVENLYGPTELTIACTLYRWSAGKRRRRSARPASSRSDTRIRGWRRWSSTNPCRRSSLAGRASCSSPGRRSPRATGWTREDSGVVRDSSGQDRHPLPYR